MQFDSTHQGGPQQPAVTPPYKDPAVNVFQGRFGLRAVWAIALYIVLFIVLSFAGMVSTRALEGKRPLPKRVDAATAKATPRSDPKPRETAITDGGQFGALALTCVILARIERRRIGVYGIGRNRMADFFPGALWGLALLSALVGILRSAHLLVFDGRALTGSAIGIFGAKWLLAFLTVGLLEEYLTRGLLQYTLTRGLYTRAERLYPDHARAVAFWTAATLMSLLFAAGHLGNPGETAAGITAVFFAGMVFSYALWYTGSLWWAIGFHMAWDWAQSFLYGVPDSGFLSAGRLFNTHPTGNPLLSGGTAGPEGSIFVLPTLLLVAVIVRFTTRRGVQPELLPLNAPQPSTLVTPGTAFEPS